MSSRKYYLYRIDWKDAAGHSGWQWIEDHKFKDYNVHTVGWLLAENKEYYTLAMSLTSEFQSGDRLQIPKKWVTKVTRIKGVSPIEYKS